ncbi:MAG: TIGR03943 family protein [Thermosynechococcaceae cyanobacterium]
MSQNSSQRRHWAGLPEWLNTFALGLWGALFLYYWHTGKLGLLIHPNYFGLTIGAGFVLLAIASLSALRMVRGQTGWREPHQPLFPPLLMSGLLLTAAVVGLLIAPKPFASDTAIQRGLQDATISTRVRPQTFRVNQSPERRSLIDWVRTLDVYPEPDAYAGQKVKVEGFAVHNSTLPTTYLTLTRFVITCCAADAYPIGLPVKLKQDRATFPADHWFSVTGQMATETLNGKRQVVIQAATVQPISEPQNPYSY